MNIRKYSRKSSRKSSHNSSHNSSRSNIGLRGGGQRAIAHGLGGFRQEVEGRVQRRHVSRKDCMTCANDKHIFILRK